MSTITHFYALAALDYVQGPPIAPWKPEWDISYYGGGALAGVTTPAWYAGVSIAGAIQEINESVNYGGFGVHGISTAGFGSVWGVIMLDYVLALHMRRMAHEAAASLCGGLPHARNWVPGGVTYAPDAADCAKVRTLLQLVEQFILDRYRPLTEILGILFPAYDNPANASVLGAGLGLGDGYGNFLSYGAYNEITGTVGAGEGPGKRLLARGFALAAAPPTLTINEQLIREHVERSWYENYTDDLHPSVGVTDPVAPPKTNKAGAYSWLKAPRYNNNAMEVGPLARMWVNGDYNPGTPGEVGGDPAGTKNQNLYPHTTFPASGYLAANLPGIGVTAAQLDGALGGVAPATYTIGVSTIDRLRARCLEAFKIVQRILGSDGNPDGGWLAMIEPGDPNYIGPGPIVGSLPLPSQGKSGFGLNEAPRGALGHWVNVGSAGRISNYQLVVPTTWNGSPADTHPGISVRGPIEEALAKGAKLTLSGVTSPVAGGGPNTELVPVEALRVIHSFDPCIACAVHVIDAKGNKISEHKSKMAQSKTK